MHKFLITIGLLVPLSMLSPCKTFGQKHDRMLYRDTARSLAARLGDLRARLTLEEKASLFSGMDMWHFNGIERLGIPPVRVTDCGHGITVVPGKDGHFTGCATCFPTAVGQAATWNRDLLYQVGVALGQEARATGASLLLAPMVNIHRSPLGGRNYESFSEDPFLSGTLAANFINGVQSQHVGACIKAIVANNQQTGQSGLLVDVSEKALREIYMRTFEIPVKEASPWAVMTAYNGVNGFPCVENQHLVTDILKNEWHYKGLVVSDWRSVKSVASFYAGVDMEMPGSGEYMGKKAILGELARGKITETELDRRVEGLLRLWIHTGTVDRVQPKIAPVLDSYVHQQLARKVAEESIVLLKNTGNLLPLQKKSIKKLAVIGPNANEARLGGGGSASVTPCYAVSPLQGLRTFCGDSVKVEFEQGCGLMGNMTTVPAQYLSHDGGRRGLQVTYFNNRELSGEPVTSAVDQLIDFSWGWAAPVPGIDKGNYSVRWTGVLSPPVPGIYKIGLAISGAGARLYLNGRLLIDAWGNAGDDNFENAFTKSRPEVSLPLEADSAYHIRIEWRKKINRNLIRLEWELPHRMSGMDKAVALAANADAAIVFAGLSNFFEGGNHDRTSLALPGEQDSLISRVAAANPNTIVVLMNGAPVSMPWISRISALLEAYYPGQEGGNAIADIIFGKVNPSGKLPETFPVRLRDNPSFGNFPGNGKTVKYEEGILVGYRHYDVRNITPLFPFGYGLSYTQFAYSNLVIKRNKLGVHLQFTVSNTGKRSGKAVAQLYVRRIGPGAAKGLKALKDFSKVEIAPGTSTSVTFDLHQDAFRFFDAGKNVWVQGKGGYEFLIGSSSADIRLRGQMHMR